MTPGHEVVGEVVAAASTARASRGGAASRVGDRAGAAWLRWTDQQCKFCARGAENLCPHSRYTGWDADGGYAEYMTVPAAYAHRLPAGLLRSAELAPLLCAGIIGYHALQRAELPPGGRLGLYGFGGSAHLAAQVALAQGATVHVLTRGEQAQAAGPGARRRLGRRARPTCRRNRWTPRSCSRPVGDLVLPALAALDRGGTLAIAGIYLSDIPPLNYEKHLFQERQLRSVTSNTRADAREFLAFAGRAQAGRHHPRVPAGAMPTRPCGTSRRAASTAPRCSPDAGTWASWPFAHSFLTDPPYGPVR